MVSKRSLRPLLVVDGYNLLFSSDAYMGLVDEMEPKVGRLSLDPFDRARERLLSDVAAFAEGSFDAVIVYDGAQNPSSERFERVTGGIRVLFSRAGRSADSLIEALTTEARDTGRDVTVVTSDSTIRATVAGPGVSFLSSRALVGEIDALSTERSCDEAVRQKKRLTLEGRLSPQSRAALERFTGRHSSSEDFSSS